MSSCVVVKEEEQRRICAGLDVPGVTEEERRRIVEKHGEKHKKTLERKNMRAREKRERIRRVCAGEDVPGVGEEERRRIIEEEERRKQKDRENKTKMREKFGEPKRKLGEGEDVEGAGEDEEVEKIKRWKERRALQEGQRMERIRRICAGEDVPGVGEEEVEKIKRWKERRALQERQRMERIRKICAGEDIPGVEEEELEKIKQWKERRALQERQRMERIRRICAGEDVPGVGEEERRRIIEREEKRKERNRMHSRKRHLEKREERRAYYVEYRKRRKETAEQREARIAKQKFNNFVRRVHRTEEEKEEMRRRNYFYKQARLAMMSAEEQEAEKRRRCEMNKEWRRNLSEEKRRNYLESVKRAVKRWQQKMKETDPEEFKNRMQKYKRYTNRMNYNKKHWEKMNEDEKRRRLNQMKMYQQKRNLRRKLEGTMDEEEIERKLDELDKRLREELGIGPPRLIFGKKGRRNCGADASSSREVSAGLLDKQEVGQWSDTTTTCYADSQAFEEEQAESNFCDFDEGASMPSPPEATELNSTPSPSPHPPQQQSVPVVPLIAPEIPVLTFPCEYCECSPMFLTENDLKSHLHDNHLKICWKCPSCKEVMISSKHLSEHFKAVHKKSSPLDSQTTEKHQAKEPSMEVLSVPYNISQEKTNYRKSGDGFSRNAEYLCLRCPIKLLNSSKIITMFKNWRDLHSHVRNKHRKYYWPCEYCHLLKYSKQSLTVHLMLCTKKSET